jgi:lipopolysaccharide export LptBFGC system permease protein LptF
MRKHSRTTKITTHDKAGNKQLALAATLMGLGVMFLWLLVSFIVSTIIGMCAGAFAFMLFGGILPSVFNEGFWLTLAVMLLGGALYLIARLWLLDGDIENDD